MITPLSTAFLFTSIVVASVQAGNLISLSFVSMRTILSPPGVHEATTLVQFRTSYAQGFWLSPPLVAIASLTSLFNAILVWWTGFDNSKALRLLLAALCMAAVIPFSLLKIVPNEEVLLGRAKRVAKCKMDAVEVTKVEGKGLSALGTRELVREWTKINYQRSVLPLAGALIAGSVLFN